ncbi:DNA polymerase delta, subunit 4 [Mucor circinelloides 1006PhL]|uniref:DNA polymerase delta, subunit 4 n=1 Tax=Mucor circinelloides f. circinelloides (strain 1006PhL) TaxID=1220926 RepID=S2IZH6_MUCC1|nr:DNA polymerase delta, subunit 4 [Mucor circinelloides 1006PhL]KAG1082178.1 hypothetical protein G6F42_022677 [Rhizopus arrhizus]
MPPNKQSQSTLNLPKSRRNTRQQQQQKLKSVHDESIVQIGKHKEPRQTTDASYKFEIHQEHLDETDKLLRAFDLNYAFGPCVGIKRLDRWERAYNLGLNPLTDVKDILTKDKTGKYKESVFHQFRMI